MRNQAVQKAQLLGLERTEWALWIEWVVISAASAVAGTLVGGFVGTIVCFLFFFTLASGWTKGDTVFCAIVGVVVGVVVGAAQSIVLQKRVHRSGWWILASTMGLAVGGAVGVIVVLVVTPVKGLWTVAGIVVGIVVGAAQWIVLRKRVYRSGWWILASAIGWAVGGAVIVIGFEIAARIGDGTGMGIMGIPVGVVIVEAITGLVLILLLRHPIPATQEPHLGESSDALVENG